MVYNFFNSIYIQYYFFVFCKYNISINLNFSQKILRYKLKCIITKKREKNKK